MIRQFRRLPGRLLRKGKVGQNQYREAPEEKARDLHKLRMLVGNVRQTERQKRWVQIKRCKMIVRIENQLLHTQNCIALLLTIGQRVFAISTSQYENSPFSPLLPSTADELPLCQSIPHHFLHSGHRPDEFQD